MRTLLCLALTGVAGAAPDPAQPMKTPYARWSHGPDSGPEYFPIAVWLQAPKNAGTFKAIGINLYIGLWKGPTEAQLAALKAAGMPVICAQNDVGLRHRDDPLILGWMHGDEPDNAQPRPGGKGYGPPIAPEKIVADYERIRRRDPSRPVLLNLGQGVAWDGWIGRGVRTGHPEDYPEYVKGCDVASFDIYPAVSTRKQVAGNLWYVARGVERLRKWAGPNRIVWNCIECTRIGNTKVKPTPHQVRAEVWMSLIHGSRGLIYFVHQFKPRFIEAGLLADADMTRAVTAINKQIRQLAPALNSPPPAEPARALTSPPAVPVAAMTRTYGGATYVFAVALRDAETAATFQIPGLREAAAEVLGENRTLPIKGGQFQDRFKGYDVHLYKCK